MITRIDCRRSECQLWSWSATTKNTEPQTKLTGTPPMSLPVRSPTQSSWYYRAKDIITLQRIQRSHIKRSASLLASRLLKRLNPGLFSYKGPQMVASIRELPLVSSFNHHRDGLASADAESGDSSSLAKIAKGVNQRS